MDDDEIKVFEGINGGYKFNIVLCPNYTVKIKSERNGTVQYISDQDGVKLVLDELIQKEQSGPNMHRMLLVARGHMEGISLFDAALNVSPEPSTTHRCTRCGTRRVSIK